MANLDRKKHRQRVKKRFIKESSFDSFAPHNILEMLLFYSIPIKDTKPLAYDLINHFGSLSAVFDAPYEELLKIHGISHHSATLIKSIIPLSRAYNNDKHCKKQTLYTVDEVSDFLLSQYVGYNDEVFSVISLDSCSRVLSFDIIAKGNINSVMGDSRKLIQILLKSGATAAIIAHNHPGGFAIPSNADLKATKKLRLACEGIEVELLDHMLIADDECISMKCSKGFSEIFVKSPLK